MQWLRVLLVVSIISPVVLRAQQTGLPPSPFGSAAPVARQQTHNVTIDVSVNDKSGNPVHGLPQQAFTLLDDKQRKNLTSFRAVDMDSGALAPPVEMVLVIDAINADVLKAQRQREGIKNFLQNNGGELALPVSIVTVTDKGMGKPMAASRDGKALASMLDQSETGLRLVNRNTAFREIES